MNSASYRTYRVGRGLIQMQDRKGSFCPNDEVSPLDETALVTAVSIPSNVRLETSRLGPMMTGPTRTEDRRGMRLQRSYHRDREFPRSPEGAKAPRRQVLEI